MKLTNFALLFSHNKCKPYMKQGYDIALGSLPQGKFEADFDCDNRFFEVQESPGVLSGEVKVHLDGEHKGDAYILHFKMQGSVCVACDRCLDPVSVPVETELKLTVKYGEEYDDSCDDLLIIPENRMRLNVASLISDSIVLEIPMRVIHEDGKCNEEMQNLLNMHRVETVKKEEEEETETDEEAYNME